MHFILFGASGRTGKLVVKELLPQGHTATALVRHESSLTPQQGLTVAIGPPLSKDDVRKALSTSPQTPHAAIFTLNTVRKSDSPFAAQVSPPRFLADSCATVCAVLEEAGVRRIVVMSTAGAGDSWSSLPLLSKGFMGLTNIKYALDDHNILDKEIRTTSMDWTLVRPVRLEFDEPKQKSAKDVRALGSNGRGMGMADNMNVANAARFLVKVAVEGIYIKEAVVVTD